MQFPVVKAYTQGRTDSLHAELKQRNSPSGSCLTGKPINHTSSQRTIEALTVIDDVNTCRLIATCEDHGGFDSALGRSFKVVRRPTCRCHVQRGLAAEIARVKDLKKVKLATSRSPAGAVGIGAVLGCQRNLSIHEPDCRHISVEPRFAGRRHGKFEEKHLVITTEAIYDVVSSLIKISGKGDGVRYATPPGRVYPQPPSSQLLSDRMMTSTSS